MSQFIYGVHAVTEFLKSSPELSIRVLIQDGRENDTKIKKIIATAKKHKLHVDSMSKDKLDGIADSGVHQGILVECKKSRTYIESDILGLLDALDHSPLVLILDGVQDPHNLGACIRTADACGVDFVIIPKDKSAPLNATVQKVSCGAMSRVKVVVATNLARSVKTLKQEGVWVYGFADEAKESIYNNDFTGGIALVMGSEGDGLRHLTRELCDHLVYIPMQGSVSSLNVSVAAGVALYEVVRQRI